jgi:tetratricopeptide (TPR) repeat protein
MVTAKARLAIIAIALVLLGWTVYGKVYELSGIVGFGILFVIYGYFREGTVVLASKAYHHKDLKKAEELLSEIKNPDRLSKKRRGYYEFISGNIELKRENFTEAERHFQIASRFPLRSENEKAMVLTQLANLNLRKHEFAKSRAYLDIAKELKTSPRVASIIENIEKEIKKGSEQ